MLKHDDIQQQVKAGKLSARKGRELAQIENDEVRRKLTEATLNDGLSHKQIKNAVRKRKGKRKKSPAKTTLTFQTETGGTMTVEGPATWSYDNVEQFLVEVLEEVRHRIKNNVGLY